VWVFGTFSEYSAKQTQAKKQFSLFWQASQLKWPKFEDNELFNMLIEGYVQGKMRGILILGYP